MLTRRNLVLAAIAAFMVASAVVALTLNRPAPFGPPQSVTHPTPDLELMARLDSDRLAPGGVLAFSVELKNIGQSPIPLAAPLCRPALQVVILDAQGRVVWSQPLPLIACPEIYPPRQTLLYPGQSLSGTFCWQLGGALSSRGQSSCAWLQLSSGAYRLAGTFYSFAIGDLPFDVAR